MSVRSFFRAIGWLTTELWPAQFVDAMRERDYRAGAEWDAAEALAEAEAEEEVWEPREQCRGCGDAKTDSHVCLRAASVVSEGRHNAEPQLPLSDSELAAVRTLLNQNFPAGVEPTPPSVPPAGIPSGRSNQ